MSVLEISNHAALLSTAQNRRVWSLLVTVFGDLTSDTDRWISGTLLNRITAAIGIKPEATRVALHRLRKESWIESKRSGRTSTYTLTAAGQRQTDAARPQIYSPKNRAGQCWLVIVEPGSPVPTSGAGTLAISADLLISNNQADITDALSVALCAPVPDWIRNRVCDESLFLATQETFITFKKLRTALQNHPPTDPLEIVALRVLIVHSWRRIILKAPALPAYIFPPSWAGEDCRQLSAELLAILPRPSLAQLEEHLR
ncbi:MAG: PaaX family transcriptional regulator [Robiginitomaculum sp.]|nr:MAG: PaaX family transcriptional regulator [Robiginitomaculum sp.]